MFKRRNILLLSIAVLLAGCSTNTFISEMEKTQALADYNSCNEIVGTWLATLDESNFSAILSLESYNKKLPQKKIAEIISNYQNTYGQVIKREFLGAHFWSGRKLITWVPNIEEKTLAYIHQQKSIDDFYIIHPKYFGLLSASQMFRGFPAGKYVILMYKSVPTNKNYAEEKITLRKVKDGNWQIHGYHIADDV